MVLFIIVTYKPKHSSNSLYVVRCGLGRLVLPCAACSGFDAHTELLRSLKSLGFHCVRRLYLFINIYNVCNTELRSLQAHKHIRPRVKITRKYYTNKRKKEVILFLFHFDIYFYLRYNDSYCKVKR